MTYDLDLELADQRGARQTLRSLIPAEGFLYFYFYPKDFTPGCTCQARAVAEKYHDLAALGCRVVGISPDKPETHLRFEQRYGLPYTILSDPGRKIAKAWGATTFFGLITRRTSYLIDAQGKIAKVYPKVDPHHFLDQLLEDLLLLKN